MIIHDRDITSPPSAPSLFKFLNGYQCVDPDRLRSRILEWGPIRPLGVLIPNPFQSRHDKNLGVGKKLVVFLEEGSLDLYETNFGERGGTGTMS